MAHSKINTMTQEDSGFGAWLLENWKHLAVFGLISQAINSLFKWLTKRSEARIKEIYQEQYNETVKPQISNLTNSIDALKESIWDLKNSIKAK